MFASDLLGGRAQKQPVLRLPPSRDVPPRTGSGAGAPSSLCPVAGGLWSDGRGPQHWVFRLGPSAWSPGKTLAVPSWVSRVKELWPARADSEEGGVAENLGRPKIGGTARLKVKSPTGRLCNPGGNIWAQKQPDTTTRARILLSAGVANPEEALWCG